MKKVLVVLIACLILASCASEPVKKQGPGDLYVDGVNLMKEKKFDKAIMKFSQITENYPFDPLALVAAVKLGDAHFDKKDYVLAATIYEGFIAAHPEDENAPYVLLRLGEAYERLSLSIDRDQGNTLKAIEKYTLLKNRYPKNQYIKLVDERLKDLEQKLTDRELYVGEFYYRTNQYNAAIVRLEYFLKKYPNAPGTDKALFYLAMSYKELAFAEKSDLYSDRLKAEYPRSIYARSTIRERKTLRLAGGPDDEEGIKRKRLNPEVRAEATQAASQPAAPGSKAPAPAQAAMAAAPSGQPAVPATKPDAQVTNEIEAALLEQPDPDKRESLIFEEDLVPQPSVSHDTALPRRQAAVGQAGEKPQQTVPETVYTTDTTKKRTIDLTPGMYQDQKAMSAAVKGEAGKAPDEGAGKATPKTAEKDKKKDLDFFDKSKPIDIVSDSMEGFDKEKYVVFKGNVIAKQADLFIFADLMEAYLNDQSNEIDKAYAKNNVKIVKQERTATSNEAIFDNRKGEIVLKGNVVVFQGKDKLTGDVVTYYVNEDKAVVEGDKFKRARVTLTPTKEKEKGK
ncbi:MAG TPA: lipopolysaccharide transport periplasmic protein LptA [Syntrophorhabdaceae bacterium]|jgi:outer membrane protein assembly factor BamD